MVQRTFTRLQPQQLTCPTESPRVRLPGHWVARGLRWFGLWITALRAEAELRALDEQELRDLGLDRGGIAYAIRCGRDEY